MELDALALHLPREEDVMKQFIHETNLRIFRTQLSEATDREKRRMLERLLAEEEAKDEERRGDRPTSRS
jgi:lipase chaperone LimK